MRSRSRDTKATRCSTSPTGTSRRIRRLRSCARLHRARNNIPGALVELDQAINEYGAGGSGGAAAAYVERAEAERSRGAPGQTLKALYLEALKADPANCEALWGASKVEMDAGALGEDAKRRLETYAKLCPRAAHRNRIRANCASGWRRSVVGFGCILGD